MTATDEWITIESLDLEGQETAQQAVIDTLYTFCEDNNVLNKPNQDIRRYKNADFPPIYRLLLRGSIKEAIAAFGAWANSGAASNNDLKDNLAMLAAQYTTLEQDKNATDSRDYKVQYNKIIKVILNLLDENDFI